MHKIYIVIVATTVLLFCIVNVLAAPQDDGSKDNPFIFRVGAVLPLNSSNPVSAFSHQEMSNVLDLWFEYHVQAFGPFESRSVPGVYFTFDKQLFNNAEDSVESQVALSEQMLSQLNEEDGTVGVDFMFASKTARLYFAQLPVNEVHGVPLLSTLSSDAAQAAFSTSFSLFASLHSALESTLAQGALVGAETFASVLDNVPVWAEACGTEVLEKMARRIGMTFLGAYAYSNSNQPMPVDGNSTTTSVEAFDAARSGHPDVLVLCGLTTDARTMLQHARAERYTPPMLAVFPDFSLVGQELEDARYVVGVSDWNPAMHFDTEGPTPEQFALLYSQLYGGRLPSSSGGIMAASFTAIQDAVHNSIKAAYDKADGVPTRPSIAELHFALSRVESETSIAGPIRFNARLFNQMERIVTQQFAPNDEAVIEVLADGTANPFVVLSQDGDGQHTWAALPVYPPFGRIARLVYPMPTYDERTYDPSFFGTTEEQVMAAVVGCACVWSIFWAAVVVIYRRADPIHYSSVPMLLLLLFGTVVMYSSVFTWGIYVTDASCAALPWLLTIGYTLTMAALLLKNVRIYMLWRAGMRLRRIHFSLAKLFAYYGAVLLVPTVLLAIWSGVDPLYAKLHVPDPVRPSNNFTTCHADTTGTVFIGVLIGYCGMLLLGNAVLSLKTWKIDKAVLNEGISLGLASYTLMLAYLVAIIVVAASGSVSLSVNYIIRSLALLLGNSVAVAVLFVPKAIALRNNKRFYEDDAGTLSLMAAGSSAPRSTDVESSKAIARKRKVPSPHAMFTASSTLDIDRTTIG